MNQPANTGNAGLDALLNIFPMNCGEFRLTQDSLIQEVERQAIQAEDDKRAPGRKAANDLDDALRSGGLS